MDLIIVAKQPVAGRAKTRLIPAFGPEGAAALAAAALADTLAAAAGSSADRVVVAFDGDPTGIVPHSMTVVPQVQGPFDHRLQAAWDHIGGPAFQIGMDTPQLTAADLDDALARLGAPGTEAVLGPAEDGGWWGIGLLACPPETFTGIETSRPDTGARQLARLGELGLATHVLATHRDVDEPADVAVVAALAPGGRFAEVATALLARVAAS